MTDEDDFITVAEAARLRQVTPPRIYQLIAQGRLRKETRFGQIVVSRGEVLGLASPAAGPPAGSGSEPASGEEIPARRRRRQAVTTPPAELPKARLIKQRKPEE